MSPKYKYSTGPYIALCSSSKLASTFPLGIMSIIMLHSPLTLLSGVWSLPHPHTITHPPPQVTQRLAVAAVGVQKKAAVALNKDPQ